MRSLDAPPTYEEAMQSKASGQPPAYEKRFPRPSAPPPPTEGVKRFPRPSAPPPPTEGASSPLPVVRMTGSWFIQFLSN